MKRRKREQRKPAEFFSLHGGRIIQVDLIIPGTVHCIQSVDSALERSWRQVAENLPTEVRIVSRIGLQQPEYLPIDR